MTESLSVTYKSPEKKTLIFLTIVTKRVKNIPNILTYLLKI